MKRPHVYIKRTFPNEQLPKVLSHTDKYAMKLAFGEKKDGKLPGTIYICLPDQNESFVAGTFSVEMN